jgi:hypothetical protein
MRHLPLGLADIPDKSDFGEGWREGGRLPNCALLSRRGFPTFSRESPTQQLACPCASGATTLQHATCTLTALGHICDCGRYRAHPPRAACATPLACWHRRRWRGGEAMCQPARPSGRSPCHSIYRAPRCRQRTRNFELFSETHCSLACTSLRGCDGLGHSVLRHRLPHARAGRLLTSALEHRFACESDPRKQVLSQAMRPTLCAFFDDCPQLAAGTAFDRPPRTCGSWRGGDFVRRVFVHRCFNSQRGILGRSQSYLHRIRHSAYREHVRRDC